MKRQTKYVLLSFITLINVGIGVAKAEQAVQAPFAMPLSEIYGPTEAALMSAGSAETNRHKNMALAEEAKAEVPGTARWAENIQFRHGDVSWLPALATMAGWPQETHERLAEIVLRESGGCPNRRGGDVVDENCQLVRVSEWNHRSDTGLLQINGVNYNTKRNRWARICSDMGICDQEPLLDALTNLKAGYLLYTYSGWDPWDPCTYGEQWAHLCKRSKKKD